MAQSFGDGWVMELAGRVVTVIAALTAIIGPTWTAINLSIKFPVI